jgi:5-methylcytosine-specific restriction endonuclease McrA
MSQPPPATHKGLDHVELAILDLLTNHAHGLDMSEIKSKLSYGGDHTHVDRRLRALRKYYHIPCKRTGKRYVYVLKGPKTGQTDSGAVGGKLRAHVLSLARGRCQMCGKTVAEDGIKLQADHKVPQAWGGLTVVENLWAICLECNNGKQAHFASYDAGEMSALLKLESVHERIANLLRLHMNEAVDSHVIEFVANATERQEDWQKRLRDLRYPVIGLKILSGRYKTPQGFTRSTYKLTNWRDLPPDHRKLIRDWEKKANRPGLIAALGLEKTTADPD